jgi:CDGSH-type Zn-finger protein
MTITITVNENGCYVIGGAKGYRVVREGSEELIDRASIALCRCGQSANKPFCDGTHKQVGFTAAPAEIEITPA